MSSPALSILPRQPAPRGESFPLQPLLHLDSLWIQVAGTSCNLRCTHCFVSAGPGEDRHALMARAEVQRHVAQGLALGVKEFYFTGGEPFVHPEMLDILADTLPHGPCTLLTNGTLFTERRLEELRRLGGGARFSLEIRVSLDGPGPEEHDTFRGRGAFARTLEGLLALEHHGLLPIVTATQGPGDDALELRERYVRMLREAGLRRPRLKLLPLFRLGREAARTRGYQAVETLADLPPESIDPARLQCSSCRAVTSRGVFVCPLLVDEPAARMGRTLGESLGAFRLAHGACFTCYVTGMTCGNA